MNQYHERSYTTHQPPFVRTGSSVPFVRTFDKRGNFFIPVTTYLLFEQGVGSAGDEPCDMLRDDFAKFVNRGDVKKTILKDLVLFEKI